MSERTRLGLGILSVAVALGMLGDGLLREVPWGVNLLLWIGAFVLSALVLARWQRITLAGGGRWLLLPVLLFAVGMVWRDSPMLKALDLMALLVALALVAVRSRSGRIRVAGILETVTCLLLAGLNTAFGSVLLVGSDIRWQEMPRSGRMRHAGAVGRGLLIALPVLFGFGALFMSADAVFERFVKGAIQVDAETLLTHLGLTLFFAWIVGGFLRRMLQSEEELLPVERTAPETGTASPAVSLGIVEVGIVVGLLDLLFFLFVLIQMRYLFGGAALVQATTGLTYAEYARRGFFELVTVAGLALPILLLAHWLLRSPSLSAERVFRLLAGAQVVLLVVIMASALQRMRLYQSEYGLTELRLYTTALMLWLGVVFAWFSATVLRGLRERFAFGALVSAFLVVGILHVLNPDGLIVQINTAREHEGREFDAHYVASLSADAVPGLLRALPTLKPSAQETLASALRRRWPDAKHDDWRTWSLSRMQAQQSVHREQALLRRIPPSQTTPPPTTAPDLPED